MTRHDARLLPAALAAWGASFLVIFGHAAWLGAVVALGALAFSARGWRPSAALALIAVACAAATAHQAVAGGHAVRDAVGDRVQAVARVESDPRPGTTGATVGLVRVELAVSALGSSGGGLHGVDARVVAWAGPEWERVRRGAHVALSATLAPASGTDDALAWRPTLTSVDGPHGLAAEVAVLRDGLRAATARLPPRLAALTQGMVIGDTAAMTAVQSRDMSAAGLTHLTAVSGAHVAIVLLTVLALMRRASAPRRAGAVALAVVLGGFVALVFPHPSVVRAATMGGAVALALWCGRPAQALPALCAGVLGVSLVAPRLACEPGFVMSVFAVAAIALWAPRMAWRLGRWLPRWLAHAVAVCVCAQAAVTPVLCVIGASVGPYAVPANVLAAWCAAPVTVLGLLGVLASAAWPPLGGFLVTAAGWCSWPVDAAARAAAAAPGGMASVPSGAWAALGSLAGIVLGIAATFSRRQRFAPVFVAALLVCMLAAAPVSRLIVQQRVPGDWAIVACDVGQGDAMLLRASDRDVVMIDTGPADGTALACLRRYGVARVSLLILTHPHADHDGGVPAIVAAMPVQQAWISPAEASAATAAVRSLTEARVPTTVARAGDAAMVGAVTIAVLAPGTDRVGEGNTGLNDASIVTLAAVGQLTLLSLGDLEHAGQRALAARIGPTRVDVVKVAHHGSDRQEVSLANLVSARIAVISVGAGNPYGHPSPQTVGLYRSRADVVTRTDRCADVVVVAGTPVALATHCPPDVAG